MLIRRQTMKRAVVLTLLGVFVAVPTRGQTTNATEQEVLKAYHTLDDASIKKDRATMERMMADDYLYIHSNGTVTSKTEEITEATSADIKWTASKLDNLKVRIYGDAA